jgi:hypothetical protein
MGSAYTDLYIDQGADFETTLDLIADDGTPINIVGYAFSSQIRKSYYSSNATANLKVVITDAANGNTLITLDAANTSNIWPGKYVYDVKMKDSADTITRVVEGIITITPGVTRNVNPTYANNA